MKRFPFFTMFLFATCLSCASRDEHAHDSDHDEEKGHDHGDAHEHGEDVPRGPHGGKIYSDGDVRLELKIEEGAGHPTFVAHVADASGRDLSPAANDLTVELVRFGERRESIAFRKEGELLRSTSIIAEPHSFRSVIRLAHSGHGHEWNDEQVEFRVEIAPEGLAMSGIETGKVEAREIDVVLESPGEVHLNEERVLEVRPRFPGIVKSLSRRLGDRVKAGDVLAVIQSNESLSDYEVPAAQRGVVVSRDAAVGETVHTETVLYTIADFSNVWVDFAIYPQHLDKVKRGQSVLITATSREDLTARGTIGYVGPLLEQDTRVSYGRILLPNEGEIWQPGLFVTVRVLVGSASALVAVPEEAIIRSRFGPAVFRAQGNVFELQPVVPGRTDGEYTEIVEGLEPGAEIATANVFVLKAELGKSEAHHDH
jgi:cobalt-zinc-cadmium efflux system membrane fusion protein